MPDNLLDTITSRLGLRLPKPPQVSPEQDELHQQMVLREQAKASPTRRAIQQMMMAPGEMLSGMLYDPTQPVNAEERNPAFAAGALGATLPFSAGRKYIKGLQHTLPDLERVASGAGPIRLYHGTTKDAAEKIMKEGVKLPDSGDTVAKDVADRYNIPWTVWRKNIPWSGYGEEVQRLSTAPYSVAVKWARNFPQGEIASGLNVQARILRAALDKGIPYEDMYEQVYQRALAAGKHQMYDMPGAAGLPDRMTPTRSGGNVLGIDTDVRAVAPWHQREVAGLLKDVERGDMSLPEALRFWNNQYRDIKIHPQSIRNVSIVR